MAATYNQLMQIANDANFKNRVQYCLMNAALLVVAESNATANHQQRVNFARTILNGSANILQAAIVAVNNATIAAEAVLATTPDFAIPDSDLLFVLETSEYNALAGVTT